MRELSRPHRDVAVRYGGAILLIVLATWIRLLCDPLLGEQFPFITYVVAVVFIAWAGGLWPALLALFLSYCSVAYFILPPRGSFVIYGFGNQVGAALFMFVGLVIALLCGSLRTAKNRTEDARAIERAQREQLHVTLQSIGDAVICTDRAGQVTFLNPMAEVLTGWTLPEAIGRPLLAVFRILQEQTRQPAEDPVARVLAQGTIVGLSNHTVLLAKDGTERPIDDSAAPIRDARGQLNGVVLVFRDVSGRRRAEEIRLQLAAIVESSDDAIIGKDLEGTITSWNAGAERLYGYRADEMIGQPISRLIPPDQSDELPSVLERLKRGEHIEQIHAARLRKDGRRLDVSIRISPIRNAAGQIIGASAIGRDISASKQAEAALRESEALKRAAIENALDAILTIDHEGRIVEFNPAAERMFGRRRAEVLGQEMAELLIPPALRTRHRQGMARFLATGEGPYLNRPVEVPALRSDGSEFLVELTIVQHPTAGLPRFTGYVHDLTARKRAEQRRNARLAVTETLAQAGTIREAAPQLLEAISDHLGWDAGVLWLVDAPAGVLRCVEVWHGSSVQVPGFEAASRATTFARGVGLPGRVWTTRQSAWIPDAVRDANFPRAAVAAQEDLHGALGCPVFTGTKVLGVIEFFSRSIQEPDPDLLEMMATIGGQIGLFLERKTAAEALRDSEEQFRSIVEMAHEGIWTLDTDARITFVNRRMSEMLGCPLEEMQGRLIWDFLFPEDQARSQQLFARRRAGVREQTDVRFRHRHGHEIWTIMAARPIWDEQGQFAGALDLFTDVTERKQAEEALRKADRHKDEFLAMLAHELRNPLAPVRNALHIMKQPRATAALVQEVRAMAERQVQHMARLLDDLLDVSRISRGRIELRRERLDLVPLLRHTVAAVQPLIEERRHQLSIQLPGEPIWLEADPHRLEQVITNLLNNAAKYTEPGGQIWLSAARRGQEVWVEVRDTGVGIAADVLPHIFDLFVQAERRLDRAEGGVGIGLTLVKRLVELHGGTVEVSSAGPGQGSRFTVHLPAPDLQETGPQAGSGKEAVGTTPLPRRRTLVVDDNHDAADTLAMLLRLEGQEVQVAHDGPAALRLAESFRPEIIFLDIGMPEMDGYEVARHLRAQPGSMQAVLIALTGWGQEEDRLRSQTAGFDLHIVKPVEPRLLHSLLTEPPRSGASLSGSAH